MTTRTSPLRFGNLAALSSRLNQVLVAIYKLVGFGVLTLILLGIVSYVGVNGLYLVHDAWISPAVVSPSDPAILDLRARIAHESWMRQKVEVDRAELDTKLAKARRVAEAEKAFQTRFQAALSNDAELRRKSLGELVSLRKDHEAAKRDLAGSASALSDLSRDRLEKEYRAKLIDQGQLLSESYQLAQMAQANVNLRQKEAEIQDRIRQVGRELEAFEGLAGAARPGRSKTLGYSALMLQKEYDRSLLDAAGADDEARAASKSVTVLDQALVQYDSMLQTMREAPLLKASEQRLHVAFVPYENQTEVAVGAPVYACRLGVLLCRRVGTVKAYLDGELRQQHPIYGRELRGQLVELKLDESQAVKRRVLHVNRAPLLL